LWSERVAGAQWHYQSWLLVRLSNGYNTLKAYGAAPAPGMQVHLCEVIHTQNQGIQTAVRLAKNNANTRYDLQAAIAYIGEAIYGTFSLWDQPS
jgi:hypothetical protein